jgi:hypothetical protein
MMRFVKQLIRLMFSECFSMTTCSHRSSPMTVGTCFTVVFFPDNQFSPRDPLYRARAARAVSTSRRSRRTSS